MKIPIHVSLDQQLLKELDRWRGKRSRSSIITAGIKRIVDESELVALDEITTGQLKGMFHARTCGCYHTDACPFWLMLNLIEANASQQN